MHVSFSSDAQDDLQNIRQYLEPRNPAALQKILIAIFTLAEQLGAFPFLGRHGRVEGTREISVPRYPYIIVYTLPDAYNLHIERVLHTRCQFPVNPQAPD